MNKYDERDEAEAQQEVNPNPTQWEAQLPAALERQLEEAKAEREAAADLVRPLHVPITARRIARDVANRSQYLRSRPLREGTLGRWELEILEELDEIEAQARALDVQSQLGSVSSLQVARETAELGNALFAVRGRFADLLIALGERHPARAKPEDPKARAQELAEIEAFLLRKKERKRLRDERRQAEEAAKQKQVARKLSAK